VRCGVCGRRCAHDERLKNRPSPPKEHTTLHRQGGGRVCEDDDGSPNQHNTCTDPVPENKCAPPQPSGSSPYALLRGWGGGRRWHSILQLDVGGGRPTHGAASAGGGGGGGRGCRGRMRLGCHVLALGGRAPTRGGLRGSRPSACGRLGLHGQSSLPKKWSRAEK
jgi:hypothetical protein